MDEPVHQWIPARNGTPGVLGEDGRLKRCGEPGGERGNDWQVIPRCMGRAVQSECTCQTYKLAQIVDVAALTERVAALEKRNASDGRGPGGGT